MMQPGRALRRPVWRHTLAAIEAAVFLGRPCLLITPRLKINLRPVQ
jgi:hypothetical protein